MAQSDRMEQQYNELKTLFLSYKRSTPMETSLENNEKDLPSKEHSKVTLAAAKQNAGAYIEKVNNANNKSRKFRTPVAKDGAEGIMKRGMDVRLTSPNSGKMVALGTIQGTDPKAKAMDGQPLANSVEVVVDCIFSPTTVLPRAQGKLKILGNAQARCITWPRLNVVRKDGTPLHSNVMVNEDGTLLQSKVAVNNKENVDPKTTTSHTEVAMQANSGSMKEKDLKKRKQSTTATTTGTAVGGILSQTESAPPEKKLPPRLGRNLRAGSSQSSYAKVYDNNVLKTTSRLQRASRQ
ncbi:uncharacterized protein LOC112272420 [Brachypodium distachyon]|nr:uncharacterized protein LOC112272420 [Brachypodium distachyon]|eukprot:XP_024318903.1 uncharacterized protein LOC112272420 [Brachypodium distachyon]